MIVQLVVLVVLVVVQSAYAKPVPDILTDVYQGPGKDNPPLFSKRYSVGDLIGGPIILDPYPPYPRPPIIPGSGPFNPNPFPGGLL